MWLETPCRGRRLIFIDGYEPHERLADQLAAAARDADVIIENDERTAAAAAALERAAAASHHAELMDWIGCISAVRPSALSPRARGQRPPSPVGKVDTVECAGDVDAG